MVIAWEAVSVYNFAKELPQHNSEKLTYGAPVMDLLVLSLKTLIDVAIGLTQFLSLIEELRKVYNGICSILVV